jgi:L-aspartate oxidase
MDQKTHVCVIGSGIAGGISALVCADSGLKVTVVTAAQDLLETATYAAQGGIVYDPLKTSKDRELLAQDIFKAGDGINYRPAVEQLITQGAAAVETFLIDRLGVNFDKTSQGNIDLILEGSHSKKRIAHQKDRTGIGIQKKLNEAMLAHPNIQILPGHSAIDLLTNAHHACETKYQHGSTEVLGCYVFDQASGDVKIIYADATVLATGGCGQVYRYTTNPTFSRGDGVAMASRAGARVSQLEYVQFHPSAFVHQGKTRFLLSEALRGHGAILRNHNGDAFMSRVHELKDLAPRDVVARAIYREMAGGKQPSVFLDMTHFSEDELKYNFPYIYTECKKYNLELSKDWIPVVPAAHYLCGGVWADLQGKTSLHKLYAVGEVACTGVHGANRLASTSLLEGLVWGAEAGKNIVKFHSKNPEWIKVKSWMTPGEQEDPALVQQDWDSLKHTMMNYVGVVRTQQRFDRASEMLPTLREQIERFYRTTKLSDSLIGLRNAVLCATLIFLHARRNTTSKGCHYLEP